MYEKISTPVLSRHKFMPRLLRSVLLGITMIVFSLAIGMLGYYSFSPTLTGLMPLSMRQ